MSKWLIAATLLLGAGPVFARSGDGGGVVVVGVIIGLFIAYGVISNYIDSQVTRGIEQRVGEVVRAAELEREKTGRIAKELEGALDQKRADLLSMRAAFDTSYVSGRQWLANYLAEALSAPDWAAARALEFKKNPAVKAADEVRRTSAEKKILRVQLKQLEYTLKTYHEYYPVLEEYSDDILNELATLDLEENDAPDADRVAKYISQEEYSKLSVTKRNQLALDKWKSRKKSNVEVGRFYERYLGYLYELEGWQVTFLGALDGLEDMGRDLLCVRDDKVHVVQAKYWSKHRTIHEKHIFQLYGTCILVPLTYPELSGKKITPVFATTTQLSETAAWAAKALKVSVKNAAMDQDYPAIKCNVNGSSKIYHLPFDQQYDRVRIISSKGELYAMTVAEAEKAGFRRAKKYYGG